MSENESNDQQQQKRVPSDGSYGAGTLSELTIFSRMEDGGTKEETFTIPYLLINFSHLVALDSMHLILGYKVIKVSKPDQMKDLGLA
jgi:hypothetical protein